MKRNSNKKLARLKFRNRPSAKAYHREITVDPQANPTTIQITLYGPDTYEHLDDMTMGAVLKKAGTAPVTWIDIAGLQDIDSVKQLAEHFQIHPLVIEDLVRPHQRPKLESYNHFLYLVARMAPYGKANDLEQLSILILPGIVISLQEEKGDGFNPVRERIRNSMGRIRNSQADYLAYAILDAAIDGYFPVLEQIGNDLIDLESTMMHSVHRVNLHQLFELRHRLALMRRAIWPLRDVTSQLMRDDIALIQTETRIFLRDCGDHASQLLDYLEHSREMVSSLMDFHFSATGMRLNEIIRVMTIITVMFSPLTFLVGVYGMNFDTHHPFNMPELRSPYGYVALCFIMLLLVMLQILYFRRRGWILTPQEAQKANRLSGTDFTK